MIAFWICAALAVSVLGFVLCVRFFMGVAWADRICEREDAAQVTRIAGELRD